MLEQNIIYVPIALAVLGLFFMLVKMSWVKKQPAGSERMQFISKSIKEGYETRSDNRLFRNTKQNQSCHLKKTKKETN